MKHYALKKRKESQWRVGMRGSRGNRRHYGAVSQNKNKNKEYQSDYYKHLKWSQIHVA